MPSFPVAAGSTVIKRGIETVPDAPEQRLTLPEWAQQILKFLKTCVGIFHASSGAATRQFFRHPLKQWHRSYRRRHRSKEKPPPPDTRPRGPCAPSESICQSFEEIPLEDCFRPRRDKGRWPGPRSPPNKWQDNASTRPSPI